MAFTPTHLLKRLAALVPAPKRHTVRYFEVFAPSAGVSAKVIREPALRRRRGCEAVQERYDTGLDGEAVRTARETTNSASTPSRSGRLPCQSALVVWIGPVFWREYSMEDILQCACCGGSRKVPAFIPCSPMAREILERLKGRRHRSPIAKARARPHQEHFDLHPEDTGVDPQYPD